MQVGFSQHSRWPICIDGLSCKVKTNAMFACDVPIPCWVQRNIEEERLRIRQRSQQADEQQHLRATVLLDNSARRANGHKQRSVLAARVSMPQQAGKQRAGSPAPRAQSPALAADGPHRSQSPAVASAQPGPAPKKHTARSKLGELVFVYRGIPICTEFVMAHPLYWCLFGS